MHFLILVTIGSSKFQFTRLLKIIDELYEEGFLENEEIVAQIGYSKYTAKNYKTFQMIDNNDFNELLSRADLVISHAGVGTIINSLKLEKKIIVFPRLKRYMEHIDDHQVEISKSFEKDNLIMVANNKNELKECIKNRYEFKPEKFKSNNNEINDLIVKIIDSI